MSQSDAFIGTALPANRDSRTHMPSPASLIRRCLFILLLAVSGAVAHAQESGEYQLGGGDSVRITVFLSPELTTEARLSESGTLTFPMLGTITLGGLTIPRAETYIADRLRQGNFVQRAQVTVNVLQYRSQQVSLLGSVARPGRYPLEVRGIRLTELLATAGGVAPGGADSIILARRGADGQIVRTTIDLPSIYLDGRTELDIVLQGGDSLYVPRQPQFYIYGQVGRPGNYPMERNMTVSQAIAKGGSLTLRARESGVRLLRRDKDGKMVESTPKMDDRLEPDDQIFVRESLF